MRYLLLAAALLVNPTAGWAQMNLVPNPSFELMDSCPNLFSGLDYCIKWFNPTLGTPNHFHSCSPVVSVPNNPLGFQVARSGNAYTGFAIQQGGVREYLGVRLKDTLESQKTYCIEAYVSFANNVMLASNSIGFYLSNQKIIDSDAVILAVVPQIHSPFSQFLTDTSAWMLVSGTFTAQGIETFLTIGNFFEDGPTQFVNVNDLAYYTDFAYYYIEDVSLKECTTNAVAVADRTPLCLYPNPSSEDLYLE